jgi:hypothetical protein
VYLARILLPAPILIPELRVIYLRILQMAILRSRTIHLPAKALQVIRDGDSLPDEIKTIDLIK